MHDILVIIAILLICRMYWSWKRHIELMQLLDSLATMIGESLDERRPR